MKKLSKQNSPFGGFRGLLALALFPLWGLGGISAQTVTIIPVGTDYTNKTVKLRVTWEGTTTPAGKVWVWIDFCPVDGGTPGGFSPATILEVNAGLGGDVDENSLNGRGFYVTASPTIVTATLDIATAPFNWCAYGSGHAPAAEAQAGGGYKLTGTPPFTINGDTKELGYYFGAGTCITSITDLTQHPGGIIPAPPGIQLSTGSSSQTTTENVALPVLKYTTTNASGATLTAGSFPDGVSGSWASNTYTISGTPTAAGTFDYTVTTTNSNGCTNAFVSGKIVVTSSVPPNSGSTWSCGSQVWSGMLRNPAGCSGVSSLSTSNPPPAQYLDNGTTYGYYYNWTCVNSYASTLCPSPWRVPDQSDFNTLISCAGGPDGGTLATVWGLTGATQDSALLLLGQYGAIWGRDQAGKSMAYVLLYAADQQAVSLDQMSSGLPVRCVK